MQIGEAATASSAAAGHFSPTQRWNNNCGPHRSPNRAIENRRRQREPTPISKRCSGLGPCSCSPTLLMFRQAQFLTDFPQRRKCISNSMDNAKRKQNFEKASKQIGIGFGGYSAITGGGVGARLKQRVARCEGGGGELLTIYRAEPGPSFQSFDIKRIGKFALQPLSAFSWLVAVWYLPRWVARLNPFATSQDNECCPVTHNCPN